MKIHFFATLRPIVGQKTIEFDLPENVTVRQMVEIVVTRFPPLRKELLDAEGELYPHVHVFINGRDAPYLDQRMETVVQVDDSVNIFPAPPACAMPKVNTQASNAFGTPGIGPNSGIPSGA